MKLLLCALALCVSMAAHAQEGGGSRHTVMRRLTLAASCAASFWDFQTTVAGASLGARESNGMLAGPDGKPRLGLMFSLKAALCGFSFVAQEKNLFGKRNAKFTDPLWTGLNGALAARFTRAALDNLSVIRALKKQQATAAIPAYLKP